MVQPPPPRLLLLLGQLQTRRPWLLLAIALLTMIPAAWGAAGLKLKSDFAELLPDNKDSVIVMRRTSSRLPGASTLSLAIRVPEKNPAALEKFVDALTPRLQALGPKWVGSVDAGVKDTQAFFDQNKLLYAKLDDLKKASDEIDERYQYEVSKASGTLLDTDEAPPPLSADSIKQRLQGGESKPKAPRDDDHPRGYYENAAGTFAAILVRTPVSGSAQTAEFRRKIEAEVAAVDPKKFDPRMEVLYTGGIITSSEDYNAIVNDLAHVGGVGIAGVLFSVLLFFWRVRTVAVMAGSLLVGLLWTFGLTRLAIGYLNSSTGFLVSIIAGNGINYAIMYMARYVEARRDQHANVEDAILIAHRDSWLPTLASAATAMLAYGSLIFTDFRGFKHFGIIGSYGMIICWSTAYLFAPALLAASEKLVPSFKEGAKAPRGQALYGLVFAKASMKFPRAVTAVGALFALVSLVLAAKYFSVDPMEYDMANIRNERRGSSAAGLLSHDVDAVVGQLGQDGLAIMTDRLDQVPMLATELNKRRDQAPADAKPFERVVTIFSLLPDQQAAKIPLIEHMVDRIQWARKRNVINDADWKELEPNLPKQKLKEIGIADLPEPVARPFTEVDGTRGRIVFIAPAKGFSVWDAHYLIRWADSFRSVTLPNGEVIKGSGQAVIFADMIKTIGEDAPKAIIISALGSILVIIVAFRGKAHALGVFVPWLIGVAALVAFLEIKHIKLNFLNFVSLPITIGIGAEYAHNLMQRYRLEGDRNLYSVVVQTGGAVVLCSMTTTIGYLALLRSINRGIVGFGLSAALGEITCVVAAVLLLPSFLQWRANARAAKGEVFEGEKHEEVAATNGGQVRLAPPPVPLCRLSRRGEGERWGVGAGSQASRLSPRSPLHDRGEGPGWASVRELLHQQERHLEPGVEAVGEQLARECAQVVGQGGDGEAAGEQSARGGVLEQRGEAAVPAVQGLVGDEGDEVVVVRRQAVEEAIEDLAAVLAVVAQPGHHRARVAARREAQQLAAVASRLGADHGGPGDRLSRAQPGPGPERVLAEVVAHGRQEERDGEAVAGVVRCPVHLERDVAIVIAAEHGRARVEVGPRAALVLAQLGAQQLEPPERGRHEVRLRLRLHEGPLEAEMQAQQRAGAGPLPVGAVAARKLADLVVLDREQLTVQGERAVTEGGAEIGDLAGRAPGGAQAGLDALRRRERGGESVDGEPHGVGDRAVLPGGRLVVRELVGGEASEAGEVAAEHTT